MTISALKCPDCGGKLDYQITLEMLDPPIGKIDTGHCPRCSRLFECVRQTGAYQTTAWAPLCRECRQPVMVVSMTDDETALFDCRDHPQERWMWTRREDRWRRVDQ